MLFSHRKITGLACGLILLASLAGCAAPAAAVPTPTAPPPIVLADSRGKTITLDGPAQRIVSLAPSNTEILFAIGAGEQMVARDAFSDYPEGAKTLPDVGGGFGELNLEMILAQKPDLVLASALSSSEQLKTIEDAGLTVFVLPNPKDFTSLYEVLRSVAVLTGHQAETETLIGNLEQRVAAVTAKLSGVSERPLVLYELDGTEPNAPWVPGPGTFIDFLISSAGGRNLGAELEGEWVQVSLEKLIEMNPDIMILGDYTWGGVTAEMVKARAGWDTLTAVQNGQIFPFDDNQVSRPGPRLVDGLEAMARLLHPDLFK